MKKLAAVLLVVAVFLFVFAAPVQAIKPAGNLASAQKVSWNLSGAVMPSPPWGLHDITGSDTSSKLIVNQPNGATEVMLTGAMNGLAPNTVYTVYMSNAWTSSDKWNIVGTWTIDFLIGGGHWVHTMIVTSQNMYDGTFTGHGYYNADTGYTWDIQPGATVIGNGITFDLIYTGSNPGYALHCTALIDSNGHFVNGVCSGSSTGTWVSTYGEATLQTVGAGHPGLFYHQNTFTFTTDAYGAGSWHVNLRDADFPGPGIYPLSVWINNNAIPATILISDNFQVTVD